MSGTDKSETEQIGGYMSLQEGGMESNCLVGKGFLFREMKLV
jgi:hypothetical protein